MHAGWLFPTALYNLLVPSHTVGLPRNFSRENFVRGKFFISEILPGRYFERKNCHEVSFGNWENFVRAKFYSGVTLPGDI